MQDLPETKQGSDKPTGKGLGERTELSKDEAHICTRHLEECSASLTTRETQMKTTRRPNQVADVQRANASDEDVD